MDGDTTAGTSVDTSKATIDTEESKNEEDIFKIIIASDIHLGYNEQDPIRGEDSFNTFEEILQHGVAHEVDFILLGGDLFHENKPSINAFHKCITLLKKYCFGDKPISVEFLSDQSKNFAHLKNPVVNYEDPNQNVSIPVFSIHGNHDDPTGTNHLSAIDILSSSGLVNYFGKWCDLNQVEIYPILMKKGLTKLAIFGLSHIKDERLSRLFRDKKVSMVRPSDENWFNLLILHQNRVPRGIKNYIPETVLPEFINLVIWGHEHDCQITPVVINKYETRISQPGSSIVTSLCYGESIEKKIGLLCVYKEKFGMQEIKLNTVRPFIYKDIILNMPEEHLTMKPSEFAKEKIILIVEEMLKNADELKTDKSPTLPLIRLVVHFGQENLVSNQIRLGQQYVDRVANPSDMFSFKVKKNKTTRFKPGRIEDIDELSGDNISDNISDLVNKYFQSQNRNLEILTTKGLCEAVSRYITKHDIDAIDDVIQHQSKKTFEKLMVLEDVQLEDDVIDDHLNKFREERASKTREDMEEIMQLLDTEARQNKSININEDDSDDCTISDLYITDATTSSKYTTNSTSTIKSTKRVVRGRGNRKTAEQKEDKKSPKRKPRGRAKAM